MTVCYSGTRPVFATEVIRAAEAGARVIALSCDGDDPLKESELDIAESELERVAKDIAKRKLGKIEGEPYVFLPFETVTGVDSKGYLRIADAEAISLLKAEPETAEEKLARKALECALMIKTL